MKHVLTGYQAMRWEWIGVCVCEGGEGGKDGVDRCVCVREERGIGVRV